MTEENSRLFLEHSRAMLRQALAVRGVPAVGERTDPPSFLAGRTTEDVGAFYQLMKHYSFRLFFRDLVLRGRERTLRGRRFYSAAKAAEYLRELERILDAEALAGLSMNHSGIMGEVMEWFLQELLWRELAVPSLRGLRLKNTTAGGDLDLLALLATHLLIVEVKSSPPKHIDIQEIRAFVERLDAFGPRYAILVEDTHLRMKDKLVPLFEQALARGGDRPITLQRLEGELFVWEKCLAVVNSKPDLVHNLQVVFRYFLREESPFSRHD